MKIIAYRNDDLGGKILNAYASYTIAQHCSRPLEFFWDANLIKRNDRVELQTEKNPYKRRYVRTMKQYFPNLTYTKLQEMRSILESGNYAIVHNLEEYIQHKDSDKVLILAGQLEMLGEEREVESLRLDPTFGDNPTELYEFLFNETGFPEELAEKVDKLATEMKLNSTVGIHVRRGDCMLMKEMLLTGERLGGYTDEELKRGARKAIRLEDYAETFERFGPLNLFVCSDSDALKTVFKSRYKNRCAHYNVRSHDRLNLFGASKHEKFFRLIHFNRISNGIEDTLIDMLLLAHCRYIIRGSSLLAKVSTMLNNDYLEIEDGAVLVDNVWGTENLRFRSRPAKRIPFPADRKANTHLASPLPASRWIENL